MLRNKVLGVLAMLTGCIMIISLHSCQKVDTRGDGFSGGSEKLNGQFKDYELIEVNNFDELYKLAQSEPSSPVTVNLNSKKHPDWNFQFTMDEHNKEIFAESEFATIDGDGEPVTYQMETIYGLKAKLPSAENNSSFLFNIEYMEGEIVDGENMYFIEQANKYDPSLGDDVYVLYNEDDVIVTEKLDCGTSELASSNLLDEQAPNSTEQSQLAWHTRKCDVLYVGDYRFYVKSHGSRKNAINYMYNRMFFASKRYYDYNSYNIEFRRARYYLYTSPGSGQPIIHWNSTTFLAQWRNYYNRSWVKNSSADVFYLFTGYNVSGVYGQARALGTVCRDRANSFAFGEYLSNTIMAQNLMAHEIGHLLGCHHTPKDDKSPLFKNFMHEDYTLWSTSMRPATKLDLDIMLWIYGHTCIVW